MSLLGGPDPGWNGVSRSPRESPGYLRTTWRTMYAVDADAWRGIAENAPFRFVRWCAILGLVIWRWAAGAPPSAAGWWPVLFLAVVLLLPDASGISLAGSSIQLRRQVRQVAYEVRNIDLSQRAAGAVVQVAAAVTEAEQSTDPPVSLADATAEFL
jgi:hypothetical protein